MSRVEYEHATDILDTVVKALNKTREANTQLLRVGQIAESSAVKTKAVKCLRATQGSLLLLDIAHRDVLQLQDKARWAGLD